MTDQPDDTFGPEPRDPDALYLYVIYDHPKDHPNVFVARLWKSKAGESIPTGEIMTCQSLDVIRDYMTFELHLTCLARMPEDDPTIVEVWL
jgi:hypothetical protein